MTWRSVFCEHCGLPTGERYDTDDTYRPTQYACENCRNTVAHGRPPRATQHEMAREPNGCRNCGSTTLTAYGDYTAEHSVTVDGDTAYVGDRIGEFSATDGSYIECRDCGYEWSGRVEW